MKKFSVVQTFAAKASASIPDEAKPGVFQKLDFTCHFKSQSNDPEEREKLRKLQEDDGIYAFLEAVLSKVEFQGEVEFEDIDGTALAPIEWVKRNQFAAAASSLAFWSVVNRDVEAKNSRESRRR